MSAKARDGQGRWCCKTIGVRVSPEENAEIDALAALSGMTKQDYCIRRMLQRDVVVVGNPRVHKALKNQMERIWKEYKGTDWDLTKWQHDIYRPSLRPYDPREIDLIRECCAKADRKFAETR